MTLVLYHHDKSTCSQKVRICLAEKAVAWDSHQVDLLNAENLSPEYLAINPNGVVPAFVHDGRPVIESAVMCEYIDEVWPGEPKLTPDDPVARADMRAWLRFIDEVPSMAVRVPSFQNVFLERFKAMSEEEYAAFRDQNTLRREFFMRLNRTGFSDAEYDNSIRQLELTVARMEKALADGPWLVGGQYTIADICIAPLFQRMDDLGLADLWADSPHVSDWFERMKARPAYQKAFYEGSRLTDQFDQLRLQAGEAP
jgi:glutathione S-transferase